MAGFQGLQGYHLLLSSSYHLYLLVSVYSSVVIPSKVRVTRVFYSNRIRVLVVVSLLFAAVTHVTAVAGLLLLLLLLLAAAQCSRKVIFTITAERALAWPTAWPTASGYQISEVLVICNSLQVCLDVT